MRLSKSAIAWMRTGATSLAILIVMGTYDRAWPTDQIDLEAIGSETIAPATTVGEKPSSPTIASETIGPNASVAGDPNSVAPADAVELWKDWPDSDGSTDRTIWSIDYRFRSLVDSKTGKEFGTPWPPPNGWAPLSELSFPLNSNWHGLEVRARQPTWELHGEWLTPQQGIQGDMSDFDWRFPDRDFTDFAKASTRWNDGQMLDLGLDLQLFDRPFNLPCEIWPTVGFRWQRFNVTAYDMTQLVQDGQWLNPPVETLGDAIDFNQQYYVVYVGGQIRGTLDLRVLPPIAWKFQGDWGDTSAYNIDHHLLGVVNRYSMERTQGGLCHFGLTTEMPILQHLSMGFQVDYTKIETTGKHRLSSPSEGIDETWDNGVSVRSEQTALTAFVRLQR